MKHKRCFPNGTVVALHLISDSRSSHRSEKCIRTQHKPAIGLINRTARAAALSALVETTTAYRFYLGVHVRSVSRFTPFYMALIDPFRKLIVYPPLLRSVRARWNQAFGTG
jgi:Protein of unknown function (DUF2867)